MYIVGIMIVAIASSFITLLLHCCVIAGKESDKKWEEEKITKKGDNKE